MSHYQLIKTQKINTTLDDLWGFISSPRNLKKITPDYMGFDITSELPSDKMYEGMIISYKVSPLFGIKTDWVTEITHIREKEFFVDEQKVGPYVFWHHQHILEPIHKGVLMKDIITYVPPFKIIGAMLHAFIIKKKLHEIFEYRREAIENIYGLYKD